jgi:hypothetical protein
MHVFWHGIEITVIDCESEPCSGGRGLIGILLSGVLVRSGGFFFYFLLDFLTLIATSTSTSTDVWELLLFSLTTQTEDFISTLSLGIRLRKTLIRAEVE